MKVFVLRALVWIFVLLAFWYWISPWFAPTMSMLSGYLMYFFFPDWVSGSGWNGARLVLFTGLPLNTDGGVQQDRFKAIANMATLGVGLPFFLALLLASKARFFVQKALIGALVLIPFQIWSICLVWLSQVLFERGVYTLQELGFSVTGSSLVALGVHIGDTIFPVMVPVLIWLFFERSFVKDTFLQKNNVTQE